MEIAEIVDACQIPLSRGLVALVDEADLELVSGYSWFAKPSTRKSAVRQRIYAAAWIDGKMTGMHNLIAGTLYVDHRNLNSLDNRRSNLRPATGTQNQANRIKTDRPTSSRFKGVSWHKQRQKWQATIRVNNHKIYLGIFENESKAAWAYDKAAAFHFGEFACVNFANGIEGSRTLTP